MFTESEKEEITKHIKNMSFNDVEREMKTLIQIGDSAHAMSARSRIGNNVVDYYRS